MFARPSRVPMTSAMIPAPSVYRVQCTACYSVTVTAVSPEEAEELACHEPIPDDAEVMDTTATWLEEADRPEDNPKEK